MQVSDALYFQLALNCTALEDESYTQIKVALKLYTIDYDRTLSVQGSGLMFLLGELV